MRVRPRRARLRPRRGPLRWARSPVAASAPLGEGGGAAAAGGLRALRRLRAAFPPAPTPFPGPAGKRNRGFPPPAAVSLKVLRVQQMGFLLRLRGGFPAGKAARFPSAPPAVTGWNRGPGRGDPRGGRWRLTVVGVAFSRRRR